MRHVVPSGPQVVVHVHGDGSQYSSSPIWGGDPVAKASAGSYRRPKHVAANVAAPGGARDQAGAGVMDPHRMAAEQPERWARYINSMWRDDDAIMQVFRVDRRTVGNWRNGAFSPRAHHQAMALRLHPQEGFEMLIAAE